MDRNARVQLQAMSLGEVTYLTRGQIERTGEAMLNPLASDRAWAGWAATICAQSEDTKSTGQLAVRRSG